MTDKKFAKIVKKKAIDYIVRNKTVHLQHIEGDMFELNLPFGSVLITISVPENWEKFYDKLFMKKG